MNKQHFRLSLKGGKTPSNTNFYHDQTMELEVSQAILLEQQVETLCLSSAYACGFEILELWVTIPHSLGSSNESVKMPGF